MAQVRMDNAKYARLRVEKREERRDTPEIPRPGLSRLCVVAEAHERVSQSVIDLWAGRVGDGLCCGCQRTRRRRLRI